MYTSVCASYWPSLPLASFPGARVPEIEGSLPPAKRPRMDSLHLPAQSPTYYNSGAQCSPLDFYATYLKSVYTRDKLPMYDRWPHVKSKKYINLALLEKEDITKQEADEFTKATIHGNIDDIRKSKRATNIGQIAQLPDGSQPKCILVEGAPGVGKSTLAWKICRKWGKGKLLEQYQLVVLLRLRDKSVRDAVNISDLFQYHDDEIQPLAVKEIRRTGGKGVLILFEGYDELPEELRTQSSIFLDVITGKKLPEATVLITSRPWASEFLHWTCKTYISQHIEVLGFTKANIESYLEGATADDDPSLLAGLKKYISCYPHINSLMYIPLNAAIVVEIYRNSRNNDTLVPKTMTEMYTSLIRSLLLRYLLDHPVHGKKRWRIHTFSDLPQDVGQQLCELGKMAHKGILDRQQMIFFDLPEDFETLGLVQCAPELYADEGEAVSYNFLHLTVQEYLAAFHLSQQPVEEQIEHFMNYSEGQNEQVKGHFHMVLTFLSGIRKFSEYPSEVLNTLCARKAKDASARAIKVVNFDTLHWLFEAQNNDVTMKVLGPVRVELNKPNVVTYKPVVTLFELDYCVKHSTCTWETLNLCDTNLDSESCASLANLIEHMPHLKNLYLPFNPNIGHTGAVPVITELKAHNAALELLVLESTAIGLEDCRALGQLLSSSTTLTWLDIAGNNFCPEAIELIINGLSHNTTLKGLNLAGSQFSLQNSKSLASVLKTNDTLVELHLLVCNIDSDGACQLANSLCTNSTLQELNLWRNPIGGQGAAAFAEMLLKNTSLKRLDLRDVSVGEEGAQKLTESLAHNQTVHLELYNKQDCKETTLITSTQIRKTATSCPLKEEILQLKSKEEMVQAEWQQWFSHRSQSYTACEYTLNGNPITVYIQQGYSIPEKLPVDSRLQYAFQSGTMFFVYHDKSQKPYQHRFKSTTMENIAELGSSWLTIYNEGTVVDPSAYVGEYMHNV